MVPASEPVELVWPEPALSALTVTARWFEHFTVAFVVMVMACAPAIDGSMLMFMAPFTAAPHMAWTVPLTDTVGDGDKVAADALLIIEMRISGMITAKTDFPFIEQPRLRNA
jgi:hypothetical protein